MRYTPAGLPAIDCRLQHAATVTEDGQPRQVSLEIKALAIGAMSRQLASLALGQSGLFAGFLASTRNGRGMLFHITDLAAGALAPEPATDSSPTTAWSNKF